MEPEEPEEDDAAPPSAINEGSESEEEEAPAKPHSAAVESDGESEADSASGDSADAEDEGKRHTDATVHVEEVESAAASDSEGEVAPQDVLEESAALVKTESTVDPSLANTAAADPSQDSESESGSEAPSGVAESAFVEAGDSAFADVDGAGSEGDESVSGDEAPDAAVEQISGSGRSADEDTGEEGHGRRVVSEPEGLSSGDEAVSEKAADDEGSDSDGPSIGADQGDDGDEGEREHNKGLPSAFDDNDDLT